MDLIYLKIVLLVNSWILAYGIPVNMLQHPTSSQSFIYHPLRENHVDPTTSTQKSAYSQESTQAEYEYKYEVTDFQTGDRKSHWEKRNGDIVTGEYSLYEPDGSLRTVQYSADSLHGFNAVVKRNPPLNPQHIENYKKGSEIMLNDRRYSKSTEGTSFSKNNNSSSRFSGLNNTTGTNIGFTINHSMSKSNELSQLY